MLLPSLFSTICLLLSVPAARAQNASNLYGTWSSGSGAVRTGPGFANPVLYSFTYPNVTGMAYSFTEDGYFEEAQYRFVSNATQPKCIEGVVIWQHGKYTLLSNGSLILTPFPADGRIQVQNPCAEVSNIITEYNQAEIFQWFMFGTDPQRGQYLQMFQFNGAPDPPMYLVARPPTMLPTQPLVNVSSSSSSSSHRKRSANGSRRELESGRMGMTGVAIFALGLIALTM